MICKAAAFASSPGSPWVLDWDDDPEEGAGPIVILKRIELMPSGKLEIDVYHRPSHKNVDGWYCSSLSRHELRRRHGSWRIIDSQILRIV